MEEFQIHGKQRKCSLCGTQWNQSRKMEACEKKCGKVFYCGAEHQEMHLEKHQKDCYPAVIAKDERQGRHLVATKDVPSGSVLITEQVIVSCPSSLGGSGKFVPVCLGCYRPVTNSYKCTKCGWPVCSQECESTDEHAENECAIFAANQVPPITMNFQYEYLKALRSLLLKGKCPESWARLLQLESHVTARRTNPARIQLSYEIIQFIQNACKLTSFDPTTIDYVVGVNAVNGFGLQLPSDPKESGRAGYFLFYLTSLLSHDCEPNCTTKFNLSKGHPEVYVVALRAIKKGEVLSTTYVDLRKNVEQRQDYLQRGYYFTCTCKRCTKEKLDLELED